MIMTNADVSVDLDFLRSRDLISVIYMHVLYESARMVGLIYMLETFFGKHLDAHFLIILQYVVLILLVMYFSKSFRLYVQILVRILDTILEPTLGWHREQRRRGR